MKFIEYGPILGGDRARLVTVLRLANDREVL
jgi:hypothetical protein